MVLRWKSKLSYILLESMIDDDSIRQLVTGYLREHPHAGDTLEGIMQWWMFRQQLDDPSAAVQRVLEQLKETGVVYERKTTSGRTLYLASQPDESLSEERSLPDEGALNRSNK